ncbi:hypothetical protein [Microcoleus sp. Pol11C1]|uniref:hypothetical protein n=2 Tax=Microcoleus TaxID=44471 RepID=UPI002FD19BD6
MEKIMEENQKSPLFTELTDSEAESLSGGGRRFWRTFASISAGVVAVGAAITPFTGPVGAAVAGVGALGLGVGIAGVNLSNKE